MTSALAKSFESGAEKYEAFRLPYPSALFDDIRDRAGHGWSRRILDVGAGTGRATVELARRGARVDVIEPSADMLAVLTRRLDDEELAALVTVRKGVFEDVDPSTTYGAVVAAQSFHWTDRATRWSRLASLLGADSRAFLFWNRWSLDPAHHDIDDVAALYATHTPDVSPDVPYDHAAPMWADDEIAASAHVRLDDRIVYDWEHALPIADYLQLLGTVSQYAIAPEDARDPLFAALPGVLGDTVHLTGSTLLLVVSTR